MDLRWLDDVIILLEERNMTRAAVRRNITQPAFSRRIRGFEDWLGVNVLERGSNRIEINQALSSNEAEIRALTQRLTELRSKISEFDPSRTTVTIAAQHAPIYSTFPDMALHAKLKSPLVSIRLRAGDHHDSMSAFLRQDADILLCYQKSDAPPMPFDTAIRRVVWGRDRLVPVVGGTLRYLVVGEGQIDGNTPAVVYPDDSYFGEILSANGRVFGTRNFTRNPVCETAFSSGIKELVLKGIGVGWLPFSMVHQEIGNGSLVSLHNGFQSEALEIVLYSNKQNVTACALLDLWDPESRRQSHLAT